MSTNLLSTFGDAVVFFNAGNWNSLAPLLDTNVTMTHVDDNKPPIVGKNDVMSYLNSKGTEDRPQFQPSTSDVFPPAFPTVTAVIKGLASWKDIISDPLWLPIRYFFTFTRNSADDDWMIKQLSGRLI
jgi:hypothetical protein